MADDAILPKVLEEPDALALAAAEAGVTETVPTENNVITDNAPAIILVLIPFFFIITASTFLPVISY
jgi:hypothetical protein